MKRVALVTGGTGVVGREVVRLLTAAGHQVTFTYCAAAEHARVLELEHGARGVRADFSAGAPALDAADLLVHCAHSLTDDAMRAFKINCLAPVEMTRAMQPRDAVFVGSTIGTQTRGVPLSFVGCQGHNAAVVAGLARELGRGGSRVNMMSLGLLTAGVSMRFDAALRAQFVAHSAVGRLGSPEEAARAIVWLATENTYITGKVVPASGGLN